MAETTVTAATTAAADSTEFTVTTPVNVFMFTADGTIGERVKMELLQKVGTGAYQPFYAKQTNWAYRRPVHLYNTQRSFFLENPGTYIVRKSASTEAIGVKVADQV